MGKCRACGRPTYGPDICTSCNLDEQLKKRGVDVKFECHCGATKTEKRLPETLAHDGPGRFECEACGEARRKREAVEEAAAAKVRAERKKNYKDRYVQKNIPPMFQDAIFENLDEDVVHKLLLSRVGILFGNFGTGKSYAGYAFARELLELEEIDEFKVVRAFRMMMEIKASFKNSGFEDIVEAYTDVPLLIVDEFGKNTGSDFEESVLFEIIATRYEFGRRTLLIVNAATKADLETLVRLDVLDRFRGSLIEFNGRSRR